jgi:hypothetical protein
VSETIMKSDAAEEKTNENNFEPEAKGGKV